MSDVMKGVIVVAALAAGALLLIRGVSIALQARSVPKSDSRHLTCLVFIGRGARLAIVAFGLAGAVIGWAYELSLLLMLSLVIGLEELYESTAVLAILRWAERQESL